MVGFSKQFEDITRNKLRDSFSLNITSLKKRLLKNLDLVDRIYVCLDNSLEFFVEEGLFKTADYFEDLDIESSNLYFNYSKLFGEVNDLLGTYESIKEKLIQMKKRVNGEIYSRGNFF